MSRRSFINGNVYRIEYEDNYRNTTSRKIRIISSYTSRYGKDYIVAFCYKRNEKRTFRADRVISKEIVENKTLSQSKYNNPKTVTPVSSYTNYSPSYNKIEEPKNTPVKQHSYNYSDNKKPKYRPGFFETIKSLFWKAVFAVVMFTIFSPFISKYIDLSSYEYKPPVDISSYTFPKTNSSIYYEKPKTQTISYTKPKTIINKEKPIVKDTIIKIETYRGTQISTIQSQNGKKYQVQGYNTNFVSYNQAVAFINNNQFEAATGISYKELNNMYSDADSNNDFSLSWHEIKTFQSNLVKKYQYKNNDIALRPDEFIAQGGGDCEDWSLITCGLLRYWGIASYVGRLSAPNGDSAHAICLVYQSIKPTNGLYFYISSDATYYGFKISAGYYIPIDYENVKDLSNAVDDSWELETIYYPEDIYGKVM